MSPATTTPLSRMRSSKSARLVLSMAWVRECWADIINPSTSDGSVGQAEVQGKLAIRETKMPAQQLDLRGLRQEARADGLDLRRRQIAAVHAPHRLALQDVV